MWDSWLLFIAQIAETSSVAHVFTILSGSITTGVFFQALSSPANAVLVGPDHLRLILPFWKYLSLDTTYLNNCRNNCQRLGGLKPCSPVWKGEGLCAPGNFDHLHLHLYELHNVLLSCITNEEGILCKIWIIWGMFSCVCVSRTWMFWGRHKLLDKIA